MENNHEQLSSLMDGELDPKGAEFLLRRISADPGMSATWQRFHLARCSLHGECAGRVDLVDRVGRLVAAEHESAPAGRRMSGWLRTAAGGAVAASVALVAIFGINNNLLNLAPGGAESESGFVSQSTSMDRQFSRQAVPVSFSPEQRPVDGGAAQQDRQRISSYVVRHNQAGGTGFISYAPILSTRPEFTTSVTEAATDEQAEPDPVSETQPKPR